MGMSIPTLRTVTVKYIVGNEVHAETFSNPEEPIINERYVTIHVGNNRSEIFVSKSILKITKVYAD